MTVKKRTKRKGRALPGQALSWRACHNRCKARGGGLQPATHIAWIIGRETYLCGKCATEWAEVWEGAKGSVEQRKAKVRAATNRVKTKAAVDVTDWRPA